MSIEAMAQHQQLHNPHGYKDARWSGDSGQGTDCASSSQHSRNRSPIDVADRTQEYDDQYQQSEGKDADNEDSEDLRELKQHRGFLHRTFAHKFLKRRLPGLFSQRAVKALEVVHDGIDRIILVLGFIAMLTGGVTYAGIFVGENFLVRVPHPADKW